MIPIYLCHREASPEDKDALVEAVNVLDYALGDTDGHGRESCPQHGPPEFRACFALNEILSGETRDIAFCTCDEDT